jgi:hypothetical protein
VRNCNNSMLREFLTNDSLHQIVRFGIHAIIIGILSFI